MNLLTFSVLYFIIILFFISSSFFKFQSRFTSLSKFLFTKCASMWDVKAFRVPLTVLTLVLLLMNFSGNVPLNPVASMYYSFTLTLSLLFWVPLIFCVLVSNFKRFCSHLLPYGRPYGLMLFLPLVELFSQLIRPLTLMIRLRTNLRAGHIMLYMFSYFRVLSLPLTPLLAVFLFLLFILELFITLLQAYIFVSLLYLYFVEANDL